jgi:hypothetical protein
MSLASLPLPEIAAEPALSPRERSLSLDRLFSTTAVHCLAIVMMVALAVPRPLSDSDIWWHLRDAQLFVATHHFLTHDLFSFTAAGAPWINHEWLAELPFYAGWRWGGNAGLYAVTVACISAIMLGVYALALARSRRPSLSLVVTAVAVLLSTVSYGPRTLLFGWLLLVIELHLLHAALRRPRTAFLLPLLFAVWINTHGSWMIGMVLFVLFVIARGLRLDTPWLRSTGMPVHRLRIWAAAFAASVAALFLNPYGWRLVFYPFDLAFHQKLNVANVIEWHTLDFQTPRGKLALLCVLAVAAAQLIRPRRWALSDIALLGLGLYSGFTYSRFLFLFAIVAAPVIAATWRARASSAAAPPRMLLNAAALLAIGVLLCARVRVHPHADARSGLPVPATLAPVLAKLPPGARVLNEYTWGGLIAWEAPGVPVFIDSRMDIFERNGTLADYLDIVRVNNSLALLDRHHITHVLFESGAPLSYFLEHTGQWRIVAQQPGVVLLERTTPLHG